MKLNIVIPIYNEQENLHELKRRLRQVCETLDTVSWQVIYVNDGSEDESMQIMLEQCEADSRFTIVELSRNFGHQAAIAAGLAHADAGVALDGIQVDVVAGQQGSRGPVVQVDEVLHPFDETVQLLLAVAEQHGMTIEVALADLGDGRDSQELLAMTGCRYGMISHMRNLGR